LNEKPRLRRSVPPQNIDAMAVYLAAQKDHAGGARSAVVQIEKRGTMQTDAIQRSFNETQH
jgi:hypothetical protein